MQPDGFPQSTFSTWVFLFLSNVPGAGEEEELGSGEEGKAPQICEAPGCPAVGGAMDVALHPAASFRMLFAASHHSEPLNCLFSFFNSAFCTMQVVLSLLGV